jgi:hypothetical protein
MNKLGNVRTAETVVRFIIILFCNIGEQKILLLQFKERIFKVEH